MKIWSSDHLSSWPGVLGSVNTGSEVNAVCFIPDGSRLASAHADSALKMWDSSNLAVGDHDGPSQANSVRAVAFSPDGTRLATASDDTTVKIWSSASDLATPLLTFSGHSPDVYPVGSHFSLWLGMRVEYLYGSLRNLSFVEILFLQSIGRRGYPQFFDAHWSIYI